jgi:hypothetical protein
MPDYLIDLLFWIGVFAFLFIILRALQARKNKKDNK